MPARPKTPIDPEAALKAAAESLYQTFQDYRGEPNWSDPIAIMPPGEDVLVVNHRVEQLSQQTFYHYGWHAVTVNEPTIKALKYFFPRVLVEATFPLTIDRIEGDGPLSLEMYGDLMNRLGWQNWPETERRVIEEFFAAWFNACLAVPLVPYAELSWCPERNAGQVLQLAAFLRLDLHPLEARWAQDESAAATSQLLCLLREQRDHIAANATLHGWNSVWGEAGVEPEAIGQVVKFLTSRRTFSRLEEASIAATDPAIQTELAAAVDGLRNAYNVWHRTLTGTGLIPKWAEQVAADMDHEP